MKGTDHFKELIKNYLDNRAKEDELFRAKYETTTRTIDDVSTIYSMLCSNPAAAVSVTWRFMPWQSMR